MTKKKKKNYKSFEPVYKEHSAHPATKQPRPINFSPADDPLKWWVFVLLFVAGIIFYFDAFNNGFIWDDEMVITPNLYIRNWSHIGEIFLTDIHHFGLDKSNFYRPLQAVSYMVDYAFWQLNPMGYHISSAIIHIINSYLIFLVLSSALGFVDQKNQPQVSRIAAACSLVWLVHPIHTQVVTYAAGRADQLVTMFMLLAIYSFIICKKCWWSVIFFICSLLSKEYGVITPGFIILVNCFGLTKNKASLTRKLIPYGVILGVYILLRMTVLNFPTDFNADLIPGLFERMLTSSMAVVNLFQLLYFPFDLSMDRNIEWQKTIWDMKVILSIGSILLSTFLILKYKNKFPVILFGFVWFCIGYFPFANVIPMNANVSEHWMYMPSVGILIISFYLLSNILNKFHRNIYYGLIFILAIYFGSILIHRNKDFRNEIVFYNQILKRQYKNARVHYNLGCAYFYAGQEDESYKHLLEAIRFKPDYAAAYGNLGQLEFRKGNVDKAIQLYEKANEIKPDLVENRANLGLAYINKNRIQDGIEQLQKALSLNPQHVAALNNMGIAYGSIGEYEKAGKYFNYALSIAPDDLSARNNLAHLHKLKNQKLK
ncbi:MAG: tetratricopeptide repeat protein [Candidatus Omnitrophota bacterium]